MINSVTFKENYRCFKKGQEIVLDNWTVLVGDQGSGKSTIIRTIREQKEKLDIDGEFPEKCIFFDSEKDNLRTLPFFGEDMLTQVNSIFASHGQGQLQTFEKLFVLEGQKPIKDAFICLDEPEAGLSLNNQWFLADVIRNLHYRYKNQVIVATHSYPIIHAAEFVLWLKDGKYEWIESEKYLSENFHKPKERFDKYILDFKNSRSQEKVESPS
jgi:predicted ATPase